MTRLRCLAVAAALTIAAVGQTATAHADPPDAPAPAPAAAPAHVTATSAPMGNTVMFVLDALGLADKGAPSPALRAHAKVRTPTWLQPEPPKTPLLYSSLVVAKF